MSYPLLPHKYHNMALFLKKNLDNKANIYVWKIEESEETLLGMCSVPTDELEEINMFLSPKSRREKLAVRALLDYIFPEKVYLEHHDNGKPFLENKLNEISISHTDNYVAIITHPSLDVGIDIESLNRDFSAVEKKALSEEEIENLSERNRNAHLAIYWCAKEAVYKRMSLSGIDFSEQIIIEDFNPRERGELEALFIDEDGCKERFDLQYETFEDHVMVWLVG